MTKAVKDYDIRTALRPGGLTRNPDGPGTYSPTGTFGRPDAREPREGSQDRPGATLRPSSPSLPDLRNVPTNK